MWLFVLLMIGTALALTTVAVATWTSHVTIPSQGNITAIGVSVYWDPSCQNEVTFINWGNIDAGASRSVTFYVKNDGDMPVRLHMEAVNWEPANAENYLTLTWDRESYLLSEESVVSATLTLSVSSSTTEIDNFSFDILIEGTETG